MTTIISDKEAVFVNQKMKEVAEAPGITLKEATSKNAHTICMLEKTHASLKKARKTKTGERRSVWHKYVNIAVLNYKTSWHRKVGCEPSGVFHGHVAYNVLDLKKRIRPQKQSTRSF